MRVSIQFGEGIDYRGAATSWFIDPSDEWTVAQMASDLSYAARCGYTTLRVNGNVLDPDSLCTDVLSDGDVVAVDLS